ncbi:tetratricopeptide repeat protein [Gilvimarinus sp. F26214L]|uniref:tetratricopeptide repeat protein n=1 Tax=Gilvimarinus sp. DZF01 TaxID=3461371 RepID=UPI004045A800
MTRFAPRHLLIPLAAAILLSACGTLPTGKERLELVEQLVAQREYAEAEAVLANIDARDPEFEALVVRRRAIRPLIAQFEENTLRRLARFKAADEWPAAEAVLQDALDKLPDSEALRSAEDAFYEDRVARLDQIEQQMLLLRGEHLSAQSSLVKEASEIHPAGLKTRWQAFRHGREAEKLARDLSSCGQRALDEGRFDLAESCLKMAASLTGDEETAARLALLDKEREREEVAAAERARAQAQAEREARVARKTEHVGQLKARYRRLIDAGWLAAAQEILTELQSQVPEDADVLSWSEDLRAIVDQHVAAHIKEGQSLYSQGQLHEALAVWQEAAKLSPGNPVLEAHIARVERFISKLERLDNEGA